MIPVFPWSKEAIRDFWRFASAGRGKFRIKDGLDAALATDLPHLAPALARYWVEVLTAPGMPERAVDFTSSFATVDADGRTTVKVPITRALLLSLLDLPAPDEGADDAGAPVPVPTPAPTLDAAAAATPTPETPPAEPALVEVVS